MSQHEHNANDDADEAVLDLARRSGRPAPTSSESARMARRLEQALAQEVSARRRAVHPLAAAAAIVFAATTAAAATALFVAPWSAPSTPAPSLSQPERAPPSPLSPVAPTLPTALPPPAVESPSASSSSPSTTTSTTSTTTTSAPQRRGRKLESISNPDAAPADLRAAAVAAAAAVAEGSDSRAATVNLWGLSGRDPAVIDELDNAIAAASDVGNDEALARMMRLSCELRLRHRRDSAAVAACRTFGQRFPDDRAALPLAFAAGGLAEEMGDLDDAIEEYTRSIVLAPFMGASGADGLLARARVRTRLGDLDEARADLRLYLQKERRPAATHDDEVQGLARALRIELP